MQKIYTQGSAPLTCLARCPKTGTLFAGSWDKHIHVFGSGTERRPTLLSGHSDFVKCLLTTVVSGTPILISGGADSNIIIWNTRTLKQIRKLKTSAKSLQDLAIDPESLPEGATEPRDSFVLFTANSGPSIQRWHVRLDTAYELPESFDAPIEAHDTSVYKLCFDADGDLWTASADKTAKHLIRHRDWQADTVLQHPDFVRDVVVADDAGVVVTACRDEEVRVWDAASGDLLCTYSGHYQEVIGLVLMGSSVVSASIDGTVRRWGLKKQEMTRYLEDLKREQTGDDLSEVQSGKKKGVLTAEEEAELAELMDEDA